MNNDLLYIIETITVDQLKKELNKNIFIDKKLKDFNKGKEVIDNLLELNNPNVDDRVKEALMIYCIYKLKGGK